MSDRFFAEVKALQILRNLTSGTQNRSTSEVKTKPFTELKYAFLWAVALGLKEKRRTPLEGSKDGVFMTGNLNDDQKAFINTIAISETNDLTIISDEDQIQRIAEEYANTGVIRLKEIIESSAGDPLWKLVDIVKTEIKEKNEPKDTFS